MNMPLTEMIIAIVSGNIGAMNAVIELTKAAPQTDPDAILAQLGPVLTLDTFEIYGPDIWTLYKDICGQSAAAMLAVLRAVQLGIATEHEVKAGIAAGHLGADRAANAARVAELIAAVKAALPKFDAKHMN
jgi:hypothetical protein